MAASLYDLSVASYLQILGGATGFMGGFSTAPLDPLFWMHHCNIDRLWEVWVQRQKQLTNRDRNPNPSLPGLAPPADW